MKRLIVIFLAALFLSGCGQKEPPVSTTAATQVEKTPTVFYDPDSKVQEQTGGAVWAYPLGEEQYRAVVPMGDKLLLIGESGRLDALNGEEGVLAASIQTDSELLSDTAFSVSDSGISYYRQAQHQVVLLDTRLVEYAHVDLPEDIVGVPVVSFATNEVYYCQGQELRALDMQTDISRLVMSHRYQQFRLLGCHLDGRMLLAKATDSEGNSRVLYLDAATGQIRYETRQQPIFYSYGSSYLTEVMDGQVRQFVFGNTDTEPVCLDAESDVYSALRQNGAVSCNTDHDYAILDLYDLTSGLRTGSVTIPDVSGMVDLDSDGRYVWALAEYAGHMTLYRWDAVQTPVADEQIYIKPLYTATRPDEAGLELCRQQAKALEDHYGIRIRLWEDAVSVPGNFPLELEHQPEVISNMLDQLETVLSQYPEVFLAKTKRGGKLQISLVRQIDGPQTYDQYFAENQAFIVLCVKSNMSRDFLHAISYIVDSHVLGNSRDYDDWAELNPRGFDYSYSYKEEQDPSYDQWLTGDTRYFANELGMTYPHEDRCGIFVRAMLPQSQSFFATPQMQKKLARLCEGIREAYGLEKESEAMPWEQYLTIPMDFSNQ